MMKKNSFRLLVLLLSGFIAACGSSGSNSTDNNSNGSTTTITGSAFAGPISGANVTVKNIGGDIVAGPVTMGGDGSYSINVPDSYLSGDLVFESTGGSFRDEATGLIVTAGALYAHVSGGTLNSGSSVHLTPATTIIQKLVAGGKTLADAEALFNIAFGFTPDISVAPKDATNPATGATEAQKLEGLRAAAFSQMTNDLSLTPVQQFDLLTALANDLSDGSLDGKDASGTVNIQTGKDLPEDIQNRFALALSNFVNDADKNKTGLTVDKIGELPFGKISLTDTYRVEYIPVTMTPKVGKTVFKLKITKTSDNSSVTGLNVSVMPMMHMATKNHSTTVDSVLDNGDGTYTCTVHYLMASTMNGMSMGYWELKVTIGGMNGEVAYFYPTVAMDMGGGTPKATLKGQSDMISGTEKRSYYLYNDGIAMVGMDHLFNLFIAAKESMMSFPAVAPGVTLNAGTAYELTANTISVEASTDGTNWVTATDKGNGHWEASPASLIHGYTGKVYVRLTVNDEQKTTDGNAPAGANDYATFDFSTMSMGMGM